MNWNLEGSRIEARYIGTHKVTGVVTNSRVKYGGEVQHSVDLDTPLVMGRRQRNGVVVNHSEVVRVLEEDVV